MNIRRYLPIMLLMMSVMLAPLQAQTYDRLWKQVEQFERKDLPKSVVDEAMKIYHKAKDEQNLPHMMKAYFTAMQYRALIAPDSLKVDVRGLEEWAGRTAAAGDRAVLYSVLAEATLQDSLKKAFGFLQLSLKDKDSLTKLSAGKLHPVVETGETSRRYFGGNLYELLARRAVRLMRHNKWNAPVWGNQTRVLPLGINDFDDFLTTSLAPASDCDFSAAVWQTYRSLLHFYDTPAGRSAWLLTAIDALDYLNAEFAGVFSDNVCRQTLHSWIERYPDAEVAPEVYLALAGYLDRKNEQDERLRVVREAMTRYPRYAGINRLKNIEKEVLNPQLSIRVSSAYPGAMHDLRLNYKNLTGFTLQLYKVDLPVTSAVLGNRTNDFVRKHARLQKEEHFGLRRTDDYLSADTVLKFQAPPAGVYLLRAVPDGRKDALSEGTLMYVTSLQVIYRPMPGGQQELVVVDAMSGRPVRGAEVVTYRPKGGGYLPVHTFAADGEGTVQTPLLTDNNIYYNARTAGDAGMPVLSYWRSTYPELRDTAPRETVELFTDRSLYRPGQTVCVSGLAYWQQGDSTRVLAGKDYTLTLYDVNRNEAGKVEVRTNDYGSFSGRFVLPSPCLTGDFSLSAGTGSNFYFKVEEYKRPSFEVTFQPVGESYRAGDSVRVTGVAKTFAGAPVQHAEVRYTVKRIHTWLYRMGGRRTGFWTGTAVTDAEGRFTVPVCLEVGSEFARDNRFYNYDVTADVTSVAGETQQATLTLPLGHTSLVLRLKSSPAIWVKEKAEPVTFSAVNLSGEPVSAEVRYQVFVLHEGKEGVPPAEGKRVLEAVAPSNKPFLPEAVRALPSGHYRLKLSATDGQGRECTHSSDFTLFSLHDKRPPVPAVDWSYQDGEEFDAQHPATLYIGSSEKDVYLLYDVFAGGKRLESKRITFSDSLLAFRFPYREEYGDGIVVSTAFVRDGRVYGHTNRIVKPKPDKKLQLRWTTFRDKLRPGQQEEWRLRILHPDGRPADAELLALMYDASLDKYGKHELPFALRFGTSLPGVGWTWYNPWFYLTVDFPLNRLREKPLEYSRLVLSVPGSAQAELSRGSRFLSARGMAGANVKFKAQADAAVEESARVADVVFESETVPVQMVSDGMEDPALSPLDGKVQLRANFAETAFFYPQLRTDTTGEASISFLLPESLTRWRFMGLAHTRNVDYGQIEATATAVKEFMLQPEMPRFVRVGDKVSVAASLVNLSDKEVKGIVRMELFHPETEKVFYAQKRKFSVRAGETGRVDFGFEVDEKQTVLACRMVAEGDTFSDGEQRYFPVLTDKQWVTETLPLNVDGPGTYTFSLDGLFNNHSKTASGQRMTVEFTGNPAWYAVQALPVMASPVNDDALSWAAAYYANQLAALVVKANPRIRQVFDSWQAQGGGAKEVFMSRLQQNEELKNILLAETPWLAEAAGEEEQRRRMAMLFDLNAMSGQRALAVDRLKALQNEEGAWSWYKGMEGNRYITTQVAEWLVRLQAMAGAGHPEGDVAVMTRKALGYLAKEAALEYKSLKEAEKKGAKELRPSEQTLRYLYMCALEGGKEADAAVNRYFVDKLAGSIGGLTVYEKALAAIVLQQAGRTAQAAAFMQSLMEYSVVTDEMGRYFDTPKARYSWFGDKIPTEVAVMEAVARITKDAEVLDQMKRWLLRQKQTQVWDTPISTVNAVYALLKADAGVLAGAGKVKITVGSEVIETPADGAVGYVKQVVSGDAVNRKTMTVEKESAGLGWGAVYAQYLESADRIGKKGNALSVGRELYRDGQRIDGSTPLKTGDKVTVRLTVTADRDMDFVQIKDNRAACMEPLAVLSGYRWGDGLGYYQATKDASTSFFVDHMPKGTYALEYQVYVTRSGRYRSGIATVQSAYAPEFGGHTEGLEVTVE